MAINMEDKKINKVTVIVNSGIREYKWGGTVNGDTICDLYFEGNEIHCVNESGAILVQISSGVPFITEWEDL